MAVVSYSGILDALKGKITAEGFTYKMANQWFNMELGTLPTSALQNSFAIRITDQENGNYESRSFCSMGVEVEFALNPLNDIYATKIGDCTKAIKSLETASHSDVEMIDAETDYTATYTEEVVVVTFDNINLQIRN